MYSVKYFLLALYVFYFIDVSVCNDQRRVYSFAGAEDIKHNDEKPVNLEWKGFEDPIRMARERHQDQIKKGKRPQYSFRSADARPIGENSEADISDAVEPETVNTQTQEPETSNESTAPPCASGSCNRNRMEQLETKRVEWLKKTVLQKLRLATPPNVTQSRKIPPNSPVMQALLKEYGIDQIRANDLEDDMEDEIKSQKLISTARTGKYNSIKNFTIEMQVNKKR